MDRCRATEPRRFGTSGLRHTETGGASQTNHRRIIKRWFNRRRLLRRLRHHRRRCRKARSPLDHHRSRQARLHDHAQAADRPGRQAVPVPGDRRLPGRGGQERDGAQLPRRRPVRHRAVAVWRAAAAAGGQPAAQSRRGGVRRQEDAGDGRLAEQAHRRRHPAQGDRPARSPARRLGPGGGAGLELRAVDRAEHHCAERPAAKSAGDPARPARPPAQEGRHREAARSGALLQPAVPHDQAGAAHAQRRRRAIAGHAGQLRAALARGDQPRRRQPQEAAQGGQRRTAGADRILGGRPRLRRPGIPLGLAGLPRQHRQRRRPAARSDRRRIQRALQNR